ncbi:unnamed protein product [Ectocarpus sp. CCAP 1310/34]|nr:unnamed protein product [Ectocarpus sp. CCAP 1310/34]
MSTRGPRLGNLQGLKREGDDDDPQAKMRRPKKEGIKILPLILMFVMFGPVVLTGLIFVFDYVANSDWGIKIGLADDPRTRLTKFYKKHNPTKMRDVDKLLKKYKGRYPEMFQRLDAKYNRRKTKEAEEEEEYVREQARYEQEAREAQDKF